MAAWCGLSSLCGGSVDVGGALGGGWLSISLGGTLDWSVRVLVLLAWAIDRDLNGDLATLDLLAVHVVASLLLQLLTSERDETEAATLAWLVACLEFADHELGDRSKGNLGGGWGVVGEDLEELGRQLACGEIRAGGHISTYAFLAKIIWKVGNHDLRLAGDAVLWWTALLAWLARVSLSRLLWVDSKSILSAVLSGKCLVGGSGQGIDLAWNVGRAGCAVGVLCLLAVLTLLLATATAGSATATASASATSTGR